MSSGGGSQSTNTVTKSDPWVGAQPYMRDIFEQSKALYDTQGAIAPYSGPQLATTPDWLKAFTGNAVGTAANQGDAAQALMWNSLSGALNPSATTYDRVNAPTIEGSGINFNPAVYNALYGNGMSPFLDSQANSLVNKTQQAWGDTSRSMYENLNQSMLPQIESQFNQAGSLGASRQALMEGQAIGRTNDALAREYGDLSTNLQGSLANLYGGAYDAAQNRSASLASQLAGLSSGERTSNAAFGLEALLNNQKTGLDASKMDMQKLITQMTAGQMIPGINQYPLSLAGALTSAYSPITAEQQALYDIARSQYYESAQAPYEALLKYAGVTQPGAAMGGTTNSTGTQPTPDTTAQNVGALGSLGMLAYLMML